MGSYAPSKLLMLLELGTFTSSTYGIWYGNLELLSFRQADRSSSVRGRGMSVFLASDHAAFGAPNAVGGSREAFVLLAPDSCTLVPGSAPPVYQFNRHDCAWLALCLASASDGSGAYVVALDAVMYGVHTLSWAAIHATVAQAVQSGFSVENPTDVTYAVLSALDWASANRRMLRIVGPGDFEALSRVPQRCPAMPWWLTTPFAA